MIYAIGTTLFLSIWVMVSRNMNQRIIIPHPQDVLGHLAMLIKDTSTYFMVFHTLRRSFISFIFAIILSILLGAMAYFVPLFKELIKPVLYFLKVVPVVAVILLILIWSNSEIAPVIVGFLMVFPLLYEGVISSLLSMDQKLLYMTEVYNVSTLYRLKDLYIPSIIFGLNNIISSAFGLVFKSVVAGEVLSHPKFSIGGQIYSEKNYLNTSGVLAWLIIMISISIALEKITKRFRGGKNRTYKY